VNAGVMENADVSNHFFRAQRCERERIPPVERQIEDALVFNRLTDRRADGLDRRHGRGHGDGLGRSSDLQPDVDGPNLLHVDFDVVDSRRPEARLLHDDAIDARLQLRRDIRAVAVRRDVADFIGADVDNRNVGTGNDGGRRIPDEPLNRAGEL